MRIVLFLLLVCMLSGCLFDLREAVESTVEHAAQTGGATGPTGWLLAFVFGGFAGGGVQAQRKRQQKKKLERKRNENPEYSIKLLRDEIQQIEETRGYGQL